MGRLFGTDGVRGVAVTELTCEIAMNIGRAAAMILAAKVGNKKPNILIGKDTRISSDTLEAALIAGITSIGANVELLGVVPTPAVAYLVKEYKADAGVMISASHNPFEDNGIKLIGGDGFKLPDEIEEEIEKLILDTPEKIVIKGGTEIGKVRSLYSGSDTYIQHILGTAEHRFNGLKVLFDCSNGSAGSTAKGIFTELGADCTFIYDKPDGYNINKDCGSTHIKNICSVVRDGGYDAGFAFDGDADRCLAVDEKGNIIDGDKIIAILSKQMKSENKLKNNTSVVTVMSNLGFHAYMKENGMETISTAVGDRYVLQEMQSKGYSFGGEQSGHIIFMEYSTTGDGQLTAVQVLDLMKKKNKKLSALIKDIKEYPQLLIGVKVNDNFKNTWKQNRKVAAVIKKAEEAFAETGRVLVRASGTEPLIRVMIEGENENDVKTWTKKIAETIRKEAL